MGPKFFSACCVAALILSGCNTPVEPVSATPAPQLAPVPVGKAHIKGSEQSSMLLDNFTAFVAAVDGVPVAAGRKGWNTPLEVRAGHHRLTVEFIRGVFTAR